MRTHVEIKSAISRVSERASQVMDNPSLTAAQKMTALKSLEVEQKGLQGELEQNARTGLLMAGGSSLEGGYQTAQGNNPRLGMAPKLNLSELDLRNLHQAAQTKQAYRVQTKASDPGSLIPPVLLPGVVSKQHEPTRILDFIPTSPISSPSIEFVSHTATTGAAGMVARGGAKPEVNLTLAQTILVARKIAAHSAIPDEILADFNTFAAYVQAELLRQITDVENQQILSGLGTGEELTGILTTAGLLVRAKATDTPLDAIEQAVKDLRVGPSFCDPTLIVMHPTDFSTVRRSKDSQLRYLLSADPSAAEVNSIWGIPVAVTTQITLGTALMGNFEIGTQGYLREGITLTSSNSSGSDFTNNLTRYLVEERLTVGVARPSAFVKITGL
ncbi:MAG: phage major capsid protein [Actinomycetota bacterium]